MSYLFQEAVSKSENSLFFCQFIRTGGGERFRLSDSQTVYFTFETSSFFCLYQPIGKVCRTLLLNNQNPLKTFTDKAFPNCKKFQKNAKPIGRLWQTNCAILTNFA